MLKFLRYPRSIASQLIILVTVSAVIFHTCMWIAFFLARPANPRIVHQLVDLVNALDWVPVDRQPELLRRFEVAHPGSPVRLIPGSTPPGKPLVGPLADLLKPLLPRGAMIDVKDEQHVDVVLPTGTTIEAALPRTSRVGPPRFGDIVFQTLLFVAFSVTLFLIWAVKGITGPLAAFAEAADRFTLDGKGEILCEGGSAEVSKAGHAFNRMQARIRRMMEDRTHMLAAIGHDLRTPITRLRLRTEAIADPDLRGALVRDLDHMDGMVHTALSFLRDGQTATPMQPLDFASLLQTICDDFTDTGSSVLYEGPDRMQVAAHSEDLRRLFTNLIENAVAHGREVIVALKRLEGRDVEVDVADDGPGIAENDKIRALTPFWRSAASHVKMNGFGLGLSIARAIAEAHGGSVILVDGVQGGLVCRVQLPIGSIEVGGPHPPKQVEDERSRSIDTV